jgi:small subunit ribosomal protein S13
MIKNFGLKKEIIKAHQKYGLNLKKIDSTLNIKQKTQYNVFFKNKLLGKTLKQNIKDNIDFIIKHKTYKGMRHKQQFPARGQRTHTNAKTKKKIKLY